MLQTQYHWYLRPVYVDGLVHERRNNSALAMESFLH